MESSQERRLGILRALVCFVVVGFVISGITNWQSLAGSTEMDNSAEVAFLLDALLYAFLTMLFFSVLGLLLWATGLLKP